MSLTFLQARDDMFSLIKTAWDTTGHAIKWPDKKFQMPKPPAPYAEVMLRHGPSSQAAFGQDGVNRYERTGLLIIRLRAPMGDGLSNTYTLAKVIADSLEGKKTSNGVWFRNTEINEQDVPGDYNQIEVTTTFIYDEIK